MPFADVAEAEAFLAAHPEVRLIEAFLIDANGVPRGKLLHRDELLADWLLASEGQTVFTIDPLK